jgi:hypothetical protein
MMIVASGKDPCAPRMGAPGSGGPAAPDVIIDPETIKEESLDLPWKVIVHNDPINLMDYVSKVFMRVFGASGIFRAAIAVPPPSGHY